MNTLTADTLAVQAGNGYTPVVQVTIGDISFLSTDPSSGLILVETIEEGQSYRATIEVRPSILQSIHPSILQAAVGKRVDITWGFTDTAQAIKSPPLFVVGVSGASEPGSVVARFDCLGWWELLSASRVVRDPSTSEDPPPVWPADTTILAILTEILVGRGNVFLDDDDGVISTYRPYYEADSLQSVLTTVRNLLDMTTSYIRLRDDGFHIVNPQPSSPLTFTYDLDGHTFFKRSDSVKAIIPNRIVMVPSLPTVNEAPDFIGVALDQDSIDHLGFLDFITVDEGITSEGEANARAYYLLQRLRAESSAGLANVPMNIGQELYDRIAISDDRLGTATTDSFVGMIRKVWAAGQYFMELGLGGLMPHLSGLYTAIAPSTIPSPVSIAPTTSPIDPIFGPPVPPSLGDPPSTILPVPIPTPTPVYVTPTPPPVFVTPTPPPVQPTPVPVPTPPWESQYE